MKNQHDDLILSTSSITGSTVRSLSDEKIGSIKDIMLDTETGEVVYAVLSVDTGFLNLDSKYFAIPWQALSFNSHHDDVFVLDVDRERLENSPGFDKDNWPTGPQTDFINEMNTYYGVESSYRSRGDSNYGNRDTKNTGFGDSSGDRNLGSRDSGFGSKETGFGTRETGTTRDSTFGSRESGMDDSSLESRSKRNPDEKGGDWL